MDGFKLFQFKFVYHNISAKDSFLILKLAKKKNLIP